MKKALDEIEDPAKKEVLGDSKSLPLPVISSSQHQCSGYYDCLVGGNESSEGN